MLPEKKLNEWLEQGVINRQVFESIQQYESAKKGRSWAYTGFLILGTAAIALGILSLIAANWEKIPGWVKLTNNFIVYSIVLYYLSIFSRKKNEKRYNLLLLFYYLMIPATIGLISQVFNTSGELFQGLLLWTLPSLYLVFSSRFRTLYYLWLVPFTVAILNMLDYYSEDSIRHIAYLVIPPAFLFASALLARIQSKNEISHAFYFWSNLLFSLNIVLFSLNSWRYSEEISILPYLSIFILLALFSLYLYFPLFGKQVMFALPALFIYLLLESGGIQSAVSRGIIFILFFISMAVLYSALNIQRLFDLFLSIAGIRMLVLYFEAFGGLLQTGFGLIASGILIITLTMGFIKWKDRIYVMLRRNI